MAELLRLSLTCAIGLATGTAYAVPAKVGLINTGRVVYAQHCACCHGARGEGTRGWQQRDQNGELPVPPHECGKTQRHQLAI